MNGIERITGRIDADAQAEIDRVLEAAKAEAARITAQYQSQADAERTSLAERNRKAAAEREERMESVAQMEARKVTLAAKQEMVERAYQLALDRLCAMPDADYIKTVATLLVQAAPDGRGAVIFSPAERERIGAAAVAMANEQLDGGKLTLSDQTRDLRGGFILANGNIEVNCTFETLVRLKKTEIAGEVANILFQ